MKLTKAIEALSNGNLRLGERIRQLDLEEKNTRGKRLAAQREWEARGKLLDAMRGVQATMPEDETIDFVVPGEYE